MVKTSNRNYLLGECESSIFQQKDATLSDKILDMFPDHISHAFKFNRNRNRYFKSKSNGLSDCWYLTYRENTSDREY